MTELHFLAPLLLFTFAMSAPPKSGKDMPPPDIAPVEAAAPVETILPEAKVSEPGPGDNRVGFEVEIQGLRIDYNTFFATVLPGELLTLKVMGQPDDYDIAFQTDVTAGLLVDDLQMTWKAPAIPGHYDIIIQDARTRQNMKINVFVLEPAENIKNGRLNGYRIGAYPSTALRGNPIYRAPMGFIPVPPEYENIKVSPSFTLGQFLCKQTTTASTKYLVLRPALILKLERLVALLNNKGIETDSLYVMSGYRTPYYNALIGNVQYSRHVFGDAADIYVDYAPRDGDMDDINGDGAVNRKDAAHLFDLVDAFDRDEVNLAIRGGLGEYDRNAAHGPFVHVDVRGVPARWGR